MTASSAQITKPSRGANSGWKSMLRSAGVLLLGFLAVVVLSLAADAVVRRFHLVGVFPLYDVRSNLLVLSYRMIFAILGSYIAARLAPRYPMGHALALGFVGLALCTWGLIISLTYFDKGPVWYPAALVVTALPCAWLGGLLGRHQLLKLGREVS